MLFSHICPEPVLVKRSFFTLKDGVSQRRERFFPHPCKGRGGARCSRPSTARKRHFFECSLCLSRACLGKIMHFIFKWLKKCRFLACRSSTVRHCQCTCRQAQRKKKTDTDKTNQNESNERRDLFHSNEKVFVPNVCLEHIGIAVPEKTRSSF